MERLLPDPRLGFAAAVTPLAPVRWWLPQTQRTQVNLDLAAGHDAKLAMRVAASMATADAAQRHETVSFGC